MTRPIRRRTAIQAALGSIAFGATAGTTPLPAVAAAPAMPSMPPSTGDAEGRHGSDALFRMAEYFADLQTTALVDSSGFPHYAGGAFLVTQRGRIRSRHTTGWALLYADRDGARLAPSEQIAVAEGTMFDVASLTKVLTSALAMRLLEQGLFSLDSRVADWFPDEFGSGERASVTIRMLLTHTAGFPIGPSAWLFTYPTLDDRHAAILREPLVYAPGAAYLYSDLSMLVLGLVLERAGDSPLDHLLADQVTAPLDMADTTYFRNTPSPEFLESRVAATEFADPALYRGARDGLIWGQVHDPNAWALEGVAGHAGVFSTVADLHTFCDVFLHHGRHGRARFLARGTVEDMLKNYTVGLPRYGTDRPADPQGLGWELDQAYLGDYGTPTTASHTGYTGATMAFHPETQSIHVMLTNRVHPRDSWGITTTSRPFWGTTMARALGITAGAGEAAAQSAPTEER